MPLTLSLVWKQNTYLGKLLRPSLNAPTAQQEEPPVFIMTANNECDLYTTNAPLDNQQEQ